ncbi:hybrid sensor histidine kinase/response regulator [Chitinophaga pendula]|uniref:hybrid sensor histidine kinase/response regulator n=1 Tax=Chitinophaga TaxID=79328 RepID=UPI000BB0A82B|nr:MULTISPECIES: hybrid sensor histidine kinase/response regulator [Chitinophaga]ASZ12535.1 hybrid sensor histidine kinase/response regulator [Chitinophaga sp. MD30]UCJ09861.1 hybrid sensor histidine kinase/response regulator [Chitinophaga pendula]
MKQQKTFTILLVDDKPENLVSLEHMLEADNREILKATSGNEALKIVLKHSDIGLIMLDVQMPDMDGYEVARLLQINPKTSNISIIFVTAINKEEQYVMRGFEEGAVDYLSKPLDVNITRAKVRVFEKLYLSQYELKEAMAEKEQVNKQLERFMYMVAHDLKSPLSGAISLLSMINDDPRIQQEPDLKDYMQIVMGATNNLTQMITSMLDYTRQNKADQVVEKIDVQALIKELIALLFPPAHIRIVTEGKLPVLQANKLKLQQVFQNLISNAIKYNDKAEGVVTIGGTDRDEFFEFYVKDNGPGVSKRDTDRIFRLFERVDNDVKEEGTGIGLNIFKLLVEEQGGKVWVDSVPGEGSTFYFLWRQHY